jgi:hypothetical protein
MIQNNHWGYQVTSADGNYNNPNKLREGGVEYIPYELAQSIQIERFYQ